jgi:hypothetical protein
MLLIWRRSLRNLSLAKRAGEKPEVDGAAIEVMTSLRMIGDDEPARFKPPLVRRERVVGEGVNIRRICRPQMELVRVVVDFPFLDIARNIEME